MMKMDTFTFFGITFYEHPVLGDEASLLVKHNGKFYHTGLYDEPCSQEEAQDAYNWAVLWMDGHVFN